MSPAMSPSRRRGPGAPVDEAEARGGGSVAFGRWCAGPRRIVELSVRAADRRHNDLVWASRKAAEKGETLDVGGSVPSLHTDLPRLEEEACEGSLVGLRPVGPHRPHAA